MSYGMSLGATEGFQRPVRSVTPRQFMAESCMPLSFTSRHLIDIHIENL